MFNISKSTENLSKIKDKDEWLDEVRGNDKWISVEEDNLPEKFLNVLVITNKKQFGISCVDSSGEIDDFICEVDGTEKITHWRPLPEPPKKS